MPHLFAALDTIVTRWVVHPTRTAVALVHHRRFDRWLPPGGHVGLGETFDAAAARELEEETGLVVGATAAVLEHGPAGRIRDAAGHGGADERVLWTPLCVDVHPVPDLPGHRHLSLSYAVLATTEALRLEAAAHHAIRWADVGHLDHHPYRLSPRLARTAREAVAAAAAWRPPRPDPTPPAARAGTVRVLPPHPERSDVTVVVADAGGQPVVETRLSPADWGVLAFGSRPVPCQYKLAEAVPPTSYVRTV